MILEIALVASSSVLLVCLAIKEIRSQKQVAQLRTDFEKVRTLLYREITERSVESVQRSKARRDFKDKMESVHARLDSHEAAFGGLWKTAQGHVVQVRDMSDGHIINCIEWVKTHSSYYPNREKIIGMFLSEQERRRIDRTWQNTNRVAKPDGTLIAPEDCYHSPFAPTPLTVKPEAKDDEDDETLRRFVDCLTSDVDRLRSDADCMRSDLDALTDLTREVWAKSKAKPKKRKK